MGLFTKTTSHQPPSTTPLVTYHITQSLSSTLTATPTIPSETFTPLTLTLTRPQTRRDSIDISVQRADGATVGHCLVQVSTGKFLACKLSHADGHRDIALSHSGHGEGATYTLDVPGVRVDTGGLRWVHDAGGLHGGTVNAERRFRLECGSGEEKKKKKKKNAKGEKEVLARFAGASGGVSEFGMLEVYGGGELVGGERDWCGLLVLTAVCVYAREERHREKQDKVKSKFEVVSGLGELIGLVGGI